MEREYLDALMLLAGIEPVAVHELANKYWPDCEAYAQPRHATPWWLVLTNAGPVVVGWRKRVISINWADTSVRAKMTGDDQTTSTLEYCHAWGYAKAVEYLQTLRSAMDMEVVNSGAPMCVWCETRVPGSCKSRYDTLTCPHRVIVPTAEEWDSATEARAAELHEGCRMPMEQARALAVSEASPDWYARGQDWGLADALTNGQSGDWVLDDIARAFAAGAQAADQSARTAELVAVSGAKGW